MLTQTVLRNNRCQMEQAHCQLQVTANIQIRLLSEQTLCWNHIAQLLLWLDTLNATIHQHGSDIKGPLHLFLFSSLAIVWNDYITAVGLLLCLCAVGLRCMGRFRCGSSAQCISFSARCDGELQCHSGEDELGCGETHSHTSTRVHTVTDGWICSW